MNTGPGCRCGNVACSALTGMICYSTVGGGSCQTAYTFVTNNKCKGADTNEYDQWYTASGFAGTTGAVLCKKWCTDAGSDCVGWGRSINQIAAVPAAGEDCTGPNEYSPLTSSCSNFWFWEEDCNCVINLPFVAFQAASTEHTSKCMIYMNDGVDPSAFFPLSAATTPILSAVTGTASSSTTVVAGTDNQWECKSKNAAQGWGYCVEVNASPALAISGADNGVRSSGLKQLEICEGNCETDENCKGNLVCFQRSGTQQIPGCGGNPNLDSGFNYCVAFGASTAISSNTYRLTVEATDCPKVVITSLTGGAVVSAALAGIPAPGDILRIGQKSGAASCGAIGDWTVAASTSATVYTISGDSGSGNAAAGTCVISCVASLPAAVVVTVKIADVNEPPTASADAYPNLVVAENSPAGTSIAWVSPTTKTSLVQEITDPDMDETYTFAIEDDGSNGRFAVSSTTGALSVSGVASNHERPTKAYILKIKITDSGGNVLTNGAGGADAGLVSVTITVTDTNEAPTFSPIEYALDGVPLYRVDYWEDGASMANTYPVGSSNALQNAIVCAVDPDINAQNTACSGGSCQTITYTITSACAGNCVGKFEATRIGGTSSSKDCFYPKVASGQFTSFNMASVPTYTIDVSATDGTNSAISMRLIINIVDRNDQPILSAATLAIGENEVTGAMANPQLMATDADALDSMTWTLDASSGDAGLGLWAVTKISNLGAKVVLTSAVTGQIKDAAAGATASQYSLSVSVTDDCSATNANGEPAGVPLTSASVSYSVCFFFRFTTSLLLSLFVVVIGDLTLFLFIFSIFY